MARLFNKHDLRKTYTLDGDWLFALDENGQGETEKWYQHFPEDNRHVIVPGCWNQELDLYTYSGIAWYQKTFTTREAWLKLEFGAVTETAKVWLDGEYLGDHYGGWTAFSFLTCAGAGSHVLTVMVDARSNPRNSIPLSRVDWFHYGGIPRSVEVSEFHAPILTGHRISYDLTEADQATVCSRVEIFNPGSAQEVTVRVLLEEKEAVMTASLPEGTSQIELPAIELDQVRRWDPDTPELYMVHMLLSCGGAEVDDEYERIGFRTVCVRDRKILLNGRPITIKGVNRHDQHPDWGWAVPPAIAHRDVQILKDMNCNAVRGSHYPNNPHFVDELDQEGLLFWSEIPMWGFPPEALGDPLTLQRGLKMHTEMIEQYYHHPSIIFWSLHNEVATESQEAYELSRQFRERIHSLDASRLIVYASNRSEKDRCFDLADVICLNTYFGWYHGKPAEWKQYLESMVKFADENGFSDKPLMMTEFGAAAMQGYSSFNRDKWTMQYQSELVGTVISLCREIDAFVGTYVWQFADINSDVEINRARSFNNKGLLDEYRRPKQAYYTVQKLYGDMKH